MVKISTNVTSLVISSSTILLSLGERPVLKPEDAAKAPVSVIVVLNMAGSVDPMSSGWSAYSYNSPTLKMRIFMLINLFTLGWRQYSYF